MSRLRLAIVNHWDTGALVASTAVSTLPVENTRLHSRGSPWRSISNAAQYITNVETGTLAANMVRFRNHNLAGGTARLRLYSDAGMTTTVYDSTALAVPAQASAYAGANYGLGGSASAAQAADDIFGNSTPFTIYFTAIAFRAARLDLVGGALATSYLQVGRIRLAMHRESAINPAYGAQLSVGSNTQGARTRGGSLRTNTGEIWKRLDLNMAYITDVDRAFWMDVLNYSQMARDVFVSVFPGDSDVRLERDYELDGKFVALDPLIYDVAYRSKHVVIEEL
jgi:hypothetical protein